MISYWFIQRDQTMIMILYAQWRVADMMIMFMQ